MTEALRLSVMSGEISAACRTLRQRRQCARSAPDRRADRGPVDAVAHADRQGTRRLEQAGLRRGRRRGAAARKQSVRPRHRDGRHDRACAAQLDRKLDTLHQLHTRIADELTPIVDKSYCEAVNKAENIGKIGDQTVKTLVDDGMQRMQTVVQIGTETNLVTGLLTASALTTFAGHPGHAGRPLHRVRAPGREAAHGLPKGERYNTLRERTAALLKLADFRKVAASR